MADHFISPVGIKETLAPDGFWLGQHEYTSVPPLWRSVNDFANHYYLTTTVNPDGTVSYSNPAYHTGVDLNLTLPGNYDADAHSPVKAAYGGTVIYAQRYPAPSTWGNLVVIRSQLSDGTAFWHRYAHMENLLINAGQKVSQGQQIGAVGNAFGRFPYHLHFDISTSGKLETSPGDWPGLDRDRLLRDYVDPLKWLREHNTATDNGGTPMPGNAMLAIATERLVIRAAPNKTSADLGRVNQWELVSVDSGTEVGPYVHLTDGRGWIAYAYLLENLHPVTARVTDNLRRRAGPGTEFAVNGVIPGGTYTVVLQGSERNGFIKVIIGQDWLSLDYLVEDAADPMPADLTDGIPDISHHTTITDFAAAFAGVPLLIHKGTQGVSFVDQTFIQHRDQYRALNPGGSVLMWHVGTNQNPIDQARNALALADGKTGIALDLEMVDPAEGGTMTLEQAETFVDYIHTVTGKWIACYLRPGYLTPRDSILANCLLWVSSAHTPPIIPYQWRLKPAPAWSINQYKQEARPGIIGPVDINRVAVKADAIPALIASISPAPVQHSKTMYIVAGDGLYVRPAPARAGGIKYAYGTPLQVLNVITPAGGYDWLEVVGPGDIKGYAARRNQATGDIYLDSTMGAPGPVTLPKTSLLGYHSYGNGGGAVLQDVAELAKAGTPMAAVVVLRQGWGGELVPSQIKDVSPQTLVIERIAPDSKDASNLLEAAGWFLDWRKDDLAAFGRKAVQLYTQYGIDRRADFHQIINEPVVVNAKGTASFWIEAMRTAEELGIKLAVLCTPFYWPALPGEVRLDGGDPGFWQDPATIEMIRAIIRGGHILLTHEYINPEPNGSWVKSPMGRFMQGLALLPDDCRGVPVLFGEYGTYSGGMMSTQDYIAHVTEGELFQRSGKYNLKGLVLWVVGPYKNAENGVSSDISPHRAALVTRIKTARF